MTRRMSTRRRAAILAANENTCHICEGKIGVGDAWDADHVIPLEISGDDSDGNLAPAHIACHRAKSKGDVRQIAKAKRVKAKHEGAYRPKATLPGGKASGWKRKISGEWVRRDD